ncbi:MAG: pyridoxamine 5'-phosphate oxidase family protein [Candidatus Dormibacteraeota bacterium]|nr:pyridoxamine 5'-phosphate oxidase family protein [Candidatus Dormibacteraeota bacterium]
MSEEERDVFLAEQKVCRMGTVQADGAPHATPVWFAWDGEAMWFYSIIKSQRWTNVVRDPRVSVVVDAGDDQYFQLRGVELIGEVEQVGEQPRVGTSIPELELPERLFARRYMGADAIPGYDGRHAWLRLRPAKVVSWDFRKLTGTEAITNPDR